MCNPDGSDSEESEDGGERGGANEVDDEEEVCLLHELI